MKVVILSLLIASATGFTVVGNNAVGRKQKSSLSMSSALIVQNKGGGHGELGFQLAKTLSTSDKITSITILQDDACKDSAEPFASYATDLPSNVKVIKASLNSDSMDAAAMKGLFGDDVSFDYIWDNASKGAAAGSTGKAVIDCAKEWNTKLLTYVSSAGCYLPDATTTFPMPETTPVKESAGQVEYENCATATHVPFCAFRPQYIYGPKSNKWDYIDWYLDRIVRDLPLPIPGDGTQKVSLTNSEDVAAIFSSVLSDEAAAAKQRIFNCGTDQLVTYTEVAELCAAAAGKDAPAIHYYDADQYGKAKFPFRLTDFYVAPDTVKSTLGWSGAKTSLKEDLVWYYETYKERNGELSAMDFSKDKEIVGDNAGYEKWDKK